MFLQEFCSIWPCYFFLLKSFILIKGLIINWWTRWINLWLIEICILVKIYLLFVKSSLKDWVKSLFRRSLWGAFTFMFIFLNLIILIEDCFFLRITLLLLFFSILADDVRIDLLILLIVIIIWTWAFLLVNYLLIMN
jgi:hypothetical protein